MAKIIINESNMDFEFEESNLYIPEKEEFMGKLPLTSICDFIYEYKKDTIFIIEAKTGIPNFNNRKSISNFQEYKKIYPFYNPANGIRMYAEINWNKYNKIDYI